jgi:BCD family chlorophyll transporter-like MFS transporter
MGNRLSIGRLSRLSTFQVGSAMSEILTAGIWNRVMVVELGMPATPVSLLLALQYVLLPLSLWAGHRSDTLPLWGLYRTNYIRIGRSLMVVAFPLLGYSVSTFEAGNAPLGWLLATIAFLLFGCGKLASGSVFLALVRDSAPPTRQGMAIGLIQTALFALYPLAAIFMGRAMEQYTPEAFWRLLLITAVVGGFFWWFAPWGVEQRGERPLSSAEKSSLRADFGRIWADPTTRAFFLFLSTATAFAWMHSNILEPFGGEVFSLPAGVTTRFNAWWGTANVLVAILLFGLRRNRPAAQQAPLAEIGLVVMALGMAALALTGFTQQQSLLSLSLLIFGAGFGLYSYGGLSLMAVMSPGRNAGTYLGLWTIANLLFRGLGSLTGGILRDLFLRPLAIHTAYGLIFLIAALGLIAAALLVRRIDFAGFAAQSEQTA